MRIAVAAAVTLVAALASRRLVDVVEVRGDSMSPALLPGDRLIVARLPPRVGDVVLARDPRDPRRELIKRVARSGPAGITLRGDNLARSTDARTFGDMAPATVRWRAVWRYWPPDRAGSLGRAPAAVPLQATEGGEPACSFPEALIAGDAGRS